MRLCRFAELDESAITQNKAEILLAKRQKPGGGEIRGNMPLTRLMMARLIKLTKALGLKLL
jgi:hypothetical protein